MKKNLYFIILFFSILFAEPVLAQTWKGRVIEKGSEKPVIYANVFLEGSTIGTITDSTGHFVLNTLQHSSLPLIISCIGYQTVRFENNDISDNFTVSLQKQDIEIREVEIKADNQQREKYLKIFEKEFLGESEYGKKCKILNEIDIYPFYNKDTKTLHVNALNPIEIINPELGYKIVYLLNSFKKSREGVKFTGYSLFIELEQKNKKDKNKIEENRLRAFVNSRLHFMRCLYNGPLRYTYFKLADNLGNVLNTSEVIFESNNGHKEICYDKALTVYFEEDGRAPYMGYSGEEGKWIWTYTALNASENGKFSGFILNEECVKIENYGYYNPESITWYGDLASWRVGDMLPYNFLVSEDKFKKEHE
jgi:hypothetical protein